MLKQAKNLLEAGGDEDEVVQINHHEKIEEVDPMEKEDTLESQITRDLAEIALVGGEVTEGEEVRFSYFLHNTEFLHIHIQNIFLLGY